MLARGSIVSRIFETKMQGSVAVFLVLFVLSGKVSLTLNSQNLLCSVSRIIQLIIYTQITCIPLLFFVKKTSCMDAFLGLAILGGVCWRRINSNVNGDTGLQTASTISHETAHK